MTRSLLTPDWRVNLANYDALYVGFSGGLDSTVLLHAVATDPALAPKLHAVHVHHGLSEHATAWQAHCQQFCEALGVPLIVHRVNFDSQANIEEGARIARYQVFSELLSSKDGLLLAHHQDDQAETLLLQLLRGSGIDGLASMPASKALAKGKLFRPFLQQSRQMLEAYAREHQLTWVEDESNQNSMFSRNHLRHHIMPLLQEKWPEAATNLARSASHCQQAKLNLGTLANLDCETLFTQKDRLDLSCLKSLEHARLTNVLRVWLQANKVRLPSTNILNRIISELILAREDATPVVQWEEVMLRRYQQTLFILHNKSLSSSSSLEWSVFPAPLQLNSDLEYLQASSATEGLKIPPGSKVTIRFREGGELFSWRGQTKQLKKLWQEWQVPPWQRDVTPLLYIDNNLAAVVGHAISDSYFCREADNIYCVEWVFAKS